LQSNEQKEEDNRTSCKARQEEALPLVARENEQTARVSETDCCDQQNLQRKCLEALDVAAYDRLLA
jgi:hypothetical protein